MCHCLAPQSDSSRLVTCLTYTPTTIDVGCGGDIIRMSSKEVSDEGKDKSIVAGAELLQPCLVAL